MYICPLAHTLLLISSAVFHTLSLAVTYVLDLKKKKGLLAWCFETKLNNTCRINLKNGVKQLVQAQVEKSKRNLLRLHDGFYDEWCRSHFCNLCLVFSSWSLRKEEEETKTLQNGTLQTQHEHFYCWLNTEPYLRLHFPFKHTPSRMHAHKTPLKNTSGIKDVKILRMCRPHGKGDMQVDALKLVYFSRHLGETYIRGLFC